jgi:hypothetical protein
MQKHVLKRELKSLGINIIKSNYVKKSDIQKVISSHIAKSVRTSSNEAEVDCMFDEIMTKFTHKTYSPNTYYMDFDKLPECVQKAFDDVEPEIEDSSYTVNTPTAFIRLTIVTKDNAEVAFEVSLGEVTQEDDDNGDDIDEIQMNEAKEMAATFDWRAQTVHFEVLEFPEDKEVVKSQLKKKVTAENKFDALEFDTFLDAYIEAALWAETAIGDPKEEEEGDRFDSSFQTMGYTEEDISKETMDQMKEDCTKFLNENYDLIKNDEDNAGNFEQAGHDFWLTRAGHGAGYWDGDWSNGDELTAACKKFKNIDLYVGDDGLVYA